VNNEERSSAISICRTFESFAFQGKLVSSVQLLKLKCCNFRAM